MKDLMSERLLSAMVLFYPNLVSERPPAALYDFADTTPWQRVCEEQRSGTWATDSTLYEAKTRGSHHFIKIHRWRGIR